MTRHENSFLLLAHQNQGHYYVRPTRLEYRQILKLGQVTLHVIHMERTSTWVGIQFPELQHEQRVIWLLGQPQKLLAEP